MDLSLDWGSNWLDFSGCVEINFFLCGDRIWLRFSVGIEIDLFFVSWVEIDRVQAEISLFLVWWSIDLVFVWEVEVDLVLGCRPQIAWF